MCRLPLQPANFSSKVFFLIMVLPSGSETKLSVYWFLDPGVPNMYHLCGHFLLKTPCWLFAGAPHVRDCPSLAIHF